MAKFDLAVGMFDVVAVRMTVDVDDWISISPGPAIFTTVLGLKLFGDGLRDLLDPHTSRQRR